jgi:hypothetical protein
LPTSNITSAWPWLKSNSEITEHVVAGVPFRTIVHEDGTIERWQQPILPAWEVPKRNPHERRPRAPDYWEAGAAAEIAELAAASDDAAVNDIAA